MPVVYLLCLSSLNFVFFSAGSRFCPNVFSCTYPVKTLIINVDLMFISCSQPLKQWEANLFKRALRFWETWPVLQVKNKRGRVLEMALSELWPSQQYNKLFGRQQSTKQQVASKPYTMSQSPQTRGKHARLFTNMLNNFILKCFNNPTLEITDCLD